MEESLVVLSSAPQPGQQYIGHTQLGVKDDRSSRRASKPVHAALVSRNRSSSLA